jgi:hypothetical protein
MDTSGSKGYSRLRHIDYPDYNSDYWLRVYDKQKKCTFWVGSNGERFTIESSVAPIDKHGGTRSVIICTPSLTLIVMSPSVP